MYLALAAGYIPLSSPNRNSDFLIKPACSFLIIGVFTMLDNPNCMFVKCENASEDFFSSSYMDEFCKMSYGCSIV